MILELSPLTTWNKTSSYPHIHPTAYVHPTAVLIGDVRVGEHVCIFPYVVLRADEGVTINIGAGTNIQDGVIMHCLKDGFIDIGAKCSIAHGALIHGPAVIGNECFIGFKAIVHNATVMNNCFVSHCALIMNVELPEGRSVPPGSIIQSNEDFDKINYISLQEYSFKKEVQLVNTELREGYIKRQLERDFVHYG